MKVLVLGTVWLFLGLAVGEKLRASDLTTEEFHRSEPLYRKGHLFELKIVPGEKSFQVFLVGHKVHAYKSREIKMKAYVVSHEATSDVDVKSQKGSFLISRPKLPAKMKLKVSHREQEEEFELNPSVEDRGAYR